MFQQQIYALVLIPFLACLTSCASLGKYHESRTSEWVASRTEIERDEFRNSETVRSPKTAGAMNRPKLATGIYRAFFRAWRPADGVGVDRFQLYVSTDHTDRWHKYASATDVHGRDLSLTKISSDVSCRRPQCRYFEDVGISVERWYLDSARKDGLRIRLYGAGGQADVRVPAGYVDGFLRHFDETRASPQARN